MKKILPLIATLALLLSACENVSEKSADSDKISVYTSFYAMYDFAKTIGGDKADVKVLCPVGTEPHDYEPTAADMAKLSQADVFIYNGMGMEHWTESIEDTLKNEQVNIVCTSDYAMDITENEDPHIWLNPKNAYAQFEAITNALIEADSQNSDYYSARLLSVKEKTDKLIADYTSAISGFSSFDIVTSHDAYSNLCDTFKLNQIPVNGVDNSEDPTPSRIAELAEYIKDKQIKYIFTEPLGTSSIIETLSDETGAQILTLDPFEGNGENKDYFTVMYENLDALKKALE